MGAAAGGAGGALAPAGSDEQARTNALYGLLAGGVAAPVVNAIGATGTGSVDAPLKLRTSSVKAMKVPQTSFVGTSAVRRW